MQELRELEVLVRSGTPIIVIETHEEQRALAALTRLAGQLYKDFQRWSVADGLVAGGLSMADEEAQFTEPEEVLQHLRRRSSRSLVALCDLHPFLREPKVVRLLRELAQTRDNHGQTLFLISHRLDVPPELSRLVARIELNLPSDEELFDIIREEARAYSEQNVGRQVRTDRTAVRKLVANLRGVSHSDARRLVRTAIFEDGAITLDDLPEINQAKFELMDMDGVLTYEFDTAVFSEVGGLDNLKAWLEQRRDSFVQADHPLDPPRGLMLLGVQGGGKSLAAKAVAGLWRVPLLRMDIGALYNKYHGESERNLRESLRLADRVAPCVLWMDEIEKGIAVGDQDGGVSRRMLGTLLTWMAERSSRVLLVATSNDIRQLPPELVRKGRLDELFFVDLPSPAVRGDIFRIHLEKREVDTSGLDLDRLAEASEGFTGAEIEAAVISALHRCHRDQRPVADTDLLWALESTVPISVTRSEDIQGLRQWAKQRAVPA
ncbi:MAG: AAA family ATPase [Natronospirillum sp.]|uniref:AAA family ATPase n=1 Tax=Natronospirillum sp. TaxID=2812955 RepID=UPI0025CEDFE7|nr:AAA family ATPase [Natronospirillum sp.]MCH8551494.1 AAA family ATPase [Natronospirillum sp.]